MNNKESSVGNAGLVAWEDTVGGLRMVERWTGISKLGCSGFALCGLELPTHCLQAVGLGRPVCHRGNSFALSLIRKGDNVEAFGTKVSLLGFQ